MANIHGDLPHTPRTPGQLHEYAKELVDRFLFNLEEFRCAPKFIHEIKQKKYGTKVNLVFFQRDDNGKKYIVEDILWRVKSDSNLEWMEARLKHICQSFHLKAEPDSSNPSEEDEEETELDIRLDIENDPDEKLYLRRTPERDEEKDE